MPPEHSHNLHTGNIGVTVSEINHIRKRYAFLVIAHTRIHLLIVLSAENALAYLEKELGLCRVVHSCSRPRSLAVFVIYESTCKYVLEFTRNATALYNLLETAGIDIMLHLDSVGAAIPVLIFLAHLALRQKKTRIDSIE